MQTGESNEDMTTPPAFKGKLSKQEIVEILERNFELYQNEPNFIKYLIELAFFLIQHQYDPNKPATAARDDPAQDPVNPPIASEGAEIITALHSTFRVESSKRVCPFCGHKTPDGARCANCGLL